MIERGAVLKAEPHKLPSGFFDDPLLQKSREDNIRKKAESTPAIVPAAGMNTQHTYPHTHTANIFSHAHGGIVAAKEPRRQHSQKGREHARCVPAAAGM